MFRVLILLYFQFTLFSPASATNPLQCCLNDGVPDNCAQALCQLENIPGDLQRYSLFEGRRSCAAHVSKIAKCLSSGTDSSECCIERADAPDEDACFGLCNGTMKLDISKLFGVRAFQSCFSMNADAVYQCIQESHSHSPSHPRNFSIVSKSSTSVSLQWRHPSKNSDSVHIYKVHVVENKGKNNQETIHDTKNTRIVIDNLASTSSYSVFVKAYGRKHRGNPDYYKSTRSKILHFTTDANLGVFNRSINLPSDAKSATLPCHLKLFVGSKPIMEWIKIGSNGKFQTIESDVYINTYTSDTEPRFLVSTLKINNLKNSDFGRYQCQVAGQPQEYGAINLQSHNYSELPPPPTPPETIYDCCSRVVQKPKCRSVCSKGNEDKRLIIRPSLYLPPPGCLDEFGNLLKCTLTPLNSESCCIRENVPYQCLGLCDTNYDVDLMKLVACAPYVKKIYLCQNEGRSVRPEGVSFVNTEYHAFDTYNFSWQSVRDAKVYHIYKRKLHGKWISETVSTNKVRVSNADEVVIIAVNDYGMSTATRMIFDNDDWIYSNV